MSRDNQKKTSEEGFSLVELAIALIVIGIIVGGILKGHELIENARLKKTISQITSYQIAISTFLDLHGALPGDFAYATSIFGSESRNGNQNGIIEGKGLARQGESVEFWHHLSLADLIPSPGKLLSRGPIHFGHGVPSSPLGGGFTVETTPETGLEGLWLMLGNENGDRGNGALLTPSQASFLTRKLDDGNPLTGKVQSREGHNIAPGKCISQGRYNFQTQEPACVLYIHLQP